MMGKKIVCGSAVTVTIVVMTSVFMWLVAVTVTV